MCGCNKSFRPARTAPASRPNLTRTVRVSPPTNNQVVALGMQTNVTNVRKMDANKREIERLKRAAIAKAKGQV